MMPALIIYGRHDDASRSLLHCRSASARQSTLWSTQSAATSLCSVVRITTETLSGIPSIVYGLFGYLCFVTALHWGYSLACRCVYGRHHDFAAHHAHNGGGAHLACRIPIREGSFGLGAGRLRTVFHIVLPSAVPGILSGVILAIGRIVGESAALMYTAGSVAQHAGPGGRRSVRFRANPLCAHVCALRARACTSTKRMPQRLCCWLSSSCINALSSFVAKKITKKQG